MLVNKCKDLLFLLHAVLAPNGAEEDLGPVEDVRRKPSPLQTLSQPAANILLASLDIAPVLSKRIAFTSSSCELYPVASSSSFQFFSMIPFSSLLYRPVLIMSGNFGLFRY